MTLRIPVKKFKQISHAAANSKLDKETREFAFGVNLSKLSDGNVIAVASNSKILACEFLYKEAGPQESITILVSDDLFKFIDFDADIVYAGGMLYIEMAGTPVEFLSNDLIIQVPYPKWYGNIPMQVPDNSDPGALSFEIELLQRIAKTTPDGRLIFPEAFNKNKPVLVRTTNNDNWFGLFLPIGEGERLNFVIRDGATIPDWIKNANT